MEGEGGGFKGGYRAMCLFSVPDPGVAKVAGNSNLGSLVKRFIWPEPNLGNGAG